MRKVPFDTPGPAVPGSWKGASGTSSVQRTCARLSRKTLPPSPSHRRWPEPPRPAVAAAAGFPSSAVLGGGAGDGLAEGAGLGLSCPSAPATAAVAPRKPLRRTAWAHRGTNLIAPPRCGVRACAPLLYG